MRIRYALLAIMLVLASACQSTTTEAPAGPPAAASDAGFPRTIKHAMGETEIPSRPLRVVALDQTFVDAVLTLDTELIGYTTYRAIEGGELPDYLEPVLDQAGQAVPVGSLEEPNLEEIAKLEPDLILSAKVRHEKLYEQLSAIAPTVFSETTGALWKDNLRLTATTLGQEQLAEQRLADYDRRTKAIGAAIKEKQGAMPEISIVRFAGEPTIRLYVENSYSGLVLSDVGFVRPQDQPTTQDSIVVDVSPENIPDLDAEHIFVATWDDPTAREAQGKIIANPLWDRLKGTKHEVSDLIWMSSVGLQGAHAMLDDVAKIFEVDPAADAR
ncbi:ABC transporter substrate-binding protein [Microlunatus parietis]|uniref:Iron complex transport system substrate-binding protein n=1 Tax=Microlunatus parietis TaxID=682979 RepID=A0A7Y9LFN9_9ACTN|nr:iron-siderophore ABC transporter substrate-binding protein [Microlunatus parietis]NYE75180.1 iron complex transport system substrate-binding protein [Microlunatus parietis]